ncbi:MAG: HDOD domain-containing protein [Betaproteobacteria bacterium]|nr:HDOD domain-containing protein [Betaproteobacteria bacterium]
MTATALAEPLVLCAAPLIDSKRQHGGMRLVISGRANSFDLEQALKSITETAADDKSPLIVAITAADMLSKLAAWARPPQAVIEIKAAWLAAASVREWLAQSKTPWSLNGSPANPIDPALMATLHSVVSATHSKETTKLGKPVIYTDAADFAAVDAAFAAGIRWVAGWPLVNHALVMKYAAAAPDNKTSNTANNTRLKANKASVMRLLQLANADADIEKLEAILKQDATLAFRLLRYINSAALGLPVQVNSFQHAVMILGYKRMIRWLSLLLMDGSSAEPNHTPIMRICLRRGFFMERLAPLFGEGMSGDELFITGLFSLLDVVFGQPFSALMDQLHLPETIADSLIDNGEPYGPILQLAKAIEVGDSDTARMQAELLGLDQGEVNLALLNAIKDTAALDLG